MAKEFQAHVKCEQCGEINYIHDALEKTIYQGAWSKAFYFCNEECANEFYLERLRRAGQ